MGFDVGAIRKDFPILHREVHGKPLVYLDNAASSQRPTQVIERISSFYSEGYANVHRGIHFLSETATTDFEKVRRQCQHFINAAKEEEIIFVRGTTEAINLVAQSFGSLLKTGDEVVISGMEHHSNIVPWQLLRDRMGITLKVIPVLEDGSLDMEAYRGLLGDRTRLVSVVHTSNSLGVVNPIAEIVKAAHEVGAKVFVDGAQAAPHGDVDVQALDCDFFAFSGHKVFGPSGIGVLYGREALLEAMPPWQGGGDMIEEVTFEKTTFNRLPHKFEAGTPNIAGVIGLGATFSYLDGVDRPAALAHETRLLEAATARVDDIPGARIIGTAEEKVSVVSLVVEGVHPQDVGTLMDQQGVAVRTGHHCTMPLMARFEVPGTIRASFAMYNTLEEVDVFGEALQKVCELLR